MVIVIESQPAECELPAAAAAAAALCNICILHPKVSAERRLNEARARLRVYASALAAAVVVRL
jgi:hypothetical protein